jgi:hypothetical protein
MEKVKFTFREDIRLSLNFFFYLKIFFTRKTHPRRYCNHPSNLLLMSIHSQFLLRYLFLQTLEIPKNEPE